MEIVRILIIVVRHKKVIQPPCPNAFIIGKAKRIANELQRFFKRVKKSKRDYALFLTIYRYGLRASEATLLTLDDVDFEHDKINIKRVKKPRRLINHEKVGFSIELGKYNFADENGSIGAYTPHYRFRKGRQLESSAGDEGGDI